MVDGSNESLYHANEEFDPNLCTGVPLQKSLEIVDVDPEPIDGRGSEVFGQIFTFLHVQDG